MFLSLFVLIKCSNKSLIISSQHSGICNESCYLCFFFLLLLFANFYGHIYRLPCSVNFAVLARTGHTSAGQYFLWPLTQVTPCEVDAHLLANRSCPTVLKKCVRHCNYKRRKTSLSTALTDVNTGDGVNESLID